MQAKLIVLILVFTAFFGSYCAQEKDDIEGVWNMKNEFAEGQYEIVQYKGKFFGKAHYYNNGKTEYKGNNEKEDYFLIDLEKEETRYTNGKIYLPDGTYYEVIIMQPNIDSLEVKMTIQNGPYTEIWTRHTTKNNNK